MNKTLTNVEDLFLILDLNRTVLPVDYNPNEFARNLNFHCQDINAGGIINSEIKYDTGTTLVVPGKTVKNP